MKEASLGAALLVLVGGCAAPTPSAGRALVQVGTLESLLAGGYDGAFPMQRLLDAGDVGLGAVDRLDGELAVIDGVPWQIRGDGAVHRLDGSARTPFGCVVRFRADRRVARGPGDDSLQPLLDAVAPGGGAWALRIRGRFAAVRTRSPERQRPPFRPLAELVREAPTFELGLVRGTMVGFRLPRSARGANLPGDHLHLVTEDGRSGGHVLAARPEDVVAEVMRLESMQVEFSPEERSIPDADAATRALQ